LPLVETRLVCMCKAGHTFGILVCIFFEIDIHLCTKYCVCECVLACILHDVPFHMLWMVPKNDMLYVQYVYFYFVFVSMCIVPIQYLIFYIIRLCIEPLEVNHVEGLHERATFMIVRPMCSFIQIAYDEAKTIFPQIFKLIRF